MLRPTADESFRRRYRFILTRAKYVSHCAQSRFLPQRGVAVGADEGLAISQGRSQDFGWGGDISEIFWGSNWIILRWFLVLN